MGRNGGRGRGFYRGGRSTGRSGRYQSQRSNKDKQQTKSTEKVKELMFHPQTVGKTHVATYATTKDAIEQYIQKEWTKGGYDVAQSLRNLQEVDIDAERPSRSLSVATKQEDKVDEQAGIDIRYQEELRRHLDRAQAMKDGMKQAYLLIFSTYCSKTMQSRLEALPEFETKIRNDPIKLLENIKMYGGISASTIPTDLNDREPNEAGQHQDDGLG